MTAFISVDGYEPKHLSFSAINGYRMCGKKYQLERVLQVEQRPGIAGIGGNAVHTATEWWDLCDAEVDVASAQAMFSAAWDLELKKRADQSPSFKIEDYAVTGRAAAQYGGKRNIDWWMDNGPLMVQRWIDWRTRDDAWTLWELPDGWPAIEVKIEATIGGVPILMFIDRIMVTGAGQLVVVDIKSGARTPDTPEQLGLYRVGVEQEYGAMFAPDWGYWWDANKGTHSSPLQLSGYNETYFADVIQGAVAGINAGSFLADPKNACWNWCGVAHQCAAVKLFV